MSAILYLYVDKSVPELYELYQNHIEVHNSNMDKERYPDAGFDLFIPESQTIRHDPNSSYYIDFKVKMEMKFKSNDNSFPTPSAFYLYPRSSISKTPLMLSNHVGIIDSGYRGNIKAAVRCIQVDQFYVQKFQRLVQICHPSLCSIKVKLVETENDLTCTSRGEGGFGSTGK
jgi:dUTP pyrophosphatase